MSLSRTEKNEKIEELLAGLTLLRGVTSSAIVDADGFVTHVRRDFDIDVDALGAAVQIMYGSAVRGSKQLKQGDTNILIAENKEGLIIVTSFGAGFILTVTADSSVMLGAVRFEVKQTIAELIPLFQ
ncbi:MAG: roadblock/LC7 domain-containing protein [bacterium]|nr:roadblock/LC7 domain-containing protein [bacterium]